MSPVPVATLALEPACGTGVANRCRPIPRLSRPLMELKP